MKIKLATKYFIFALIFGLVAINLFSSLSKKDNLTVIKSEVSSFSQSKSYFALLNLWYSFARNQDWVNAQKLESEVSSADLLSFKRQYDPVFLQRRAQAISQKNEQTVEDWIELSKIYTSLNQSQNAIDALQQARRLDPLRTDIEKIEFDINN